jgi:omega-amidase
MNNLIVTLIQPDLAWEDKEKNLGRFENLFQLLKQKQDLIVLPEMFNTGFVVEPHSIAETMEGNTIQWMKKQAASTESVITGSLVVEEDGQYFNRLIWMSPDGSFSTYDKRHLFRLGDEHLQFSQGNQKLIVELKGWKICPLVCYDLRFPVWSKNIFENGTYAYDVLIYIANWPGRRSYAYRQLIIARAIENQCYVIGVNRVGMDGKNIMYQGDSAVLDYKGKHLIEIPPGVEDMETLSLDYENLREFREGFTVGMDWDDFEIKDKG